jgi:hypothetical protein
MKEQSILNGLKVSVLPFGLPLHGEALTVANPGPTITGQIHLDPNGPILGLDHMSIVQRVSYDLLGEFLQ